MKKKLSTYLPYIILLLVIGFNLYLYFPELQIKSDPNDNIFQFALIDHLNEVWNESAQLCQGNRVTCYTLHVTRMFDHWVPQWAQGYPLPFYYSHLPQIVIVASYRFFKFIISQLTIINYQLTIFYYFNLIKYLVLCLLPLSFFIAGRNFGFSSLASSLAAIFASQISTDGLYGIDPPSYLWRGYGLSSQLFAIFFLPLAVSYVFRALKENQNSKKSQNKDHAKLNKRHAELVSASKNRESKIPKQVRDDRLHLTPNIFKAIFFLWLTAEAHLGMGLIAFISALIFVLMDFDLKHVFRRTKRLLIIYLGAFFFLSYHIIPFLYYNKYHNVSFWDPIWKFKSFGIEEVGRMFLSGELFDFGRAPIMTGLAILGFFWALVSSSKEILHQCHAEFSSASGSRNKFRLGILNQVQDDRKRSTSPLFALALLFPFWLFLFFGSKTWGPLLEMLPGIRGFHQHRFIVGVQFIAVFLAAIGAERFIPFLISRIRLIRPIRPISPIIALLLSLALLGALIVPQTIRYAQHNTFLIKTANQRFEEDWLDFENLLKTLNQLPKARVYAGRSGNWGREFKLGDTQLYMALSVRGFPILGFLPETWSHNSDTEQFFDERRFEHYELYNIGYVVAPDEISFAEFVVPLEKFGKFNLYQVDTSGYFILGTKNISVESTKSNFSNLTHLWQISPLVKESSFPSLTLENRVNNRHPELVSGSNSQRLKIPNQVRNDNSTITMIDEVTYRINKSTDSQKDVNIFSRKPLFSPSSSPSGKIVSEKVSSQKYQAKIKVESPCQDCVLIFKMTYHPNWQFTLDNKKVDQQIFFPFFQGIEITPGEHEIVALYQPNQLRMVLLSVELLALLYLLFKRIATMKHD